MGLIRLGTELRSISWKLDSFMVDSHEKKGTLLTQRGMWKGLQANVFFKKNMNSKNKFQTWNDSLGFRIESDDLPFG